jgi:thioesterase domain-containing protein/acyl carrier protein
VRSRPGNRIDREVATFDVTLADEQGDVLVELEGYQMRRLPSGSALGQMRVGGRLRPSAGGAAHAHAPTPAERVFLETFANGIRIEEGAEALERALAAPTGGPLVVSSIDLARWRDRLERACAAEIESPTVTFARPELESEYEAPRDEIEKQLASWWQELLGVDRVGIRDDFFALGGHSLIAVRLFAKIKKQWGVDAPISVLFEAPTIAKVSDLLRAELGSLDAGAPPPAPRGPKHRFLVAMNEVGATRKSPFFLVSGMFGNVLNLRHLAAHLGKDQPVYALQAKGLYGEDEPHRRFEEMAADYLREVRTVQPEGPYLLGGFSGGGITAFEMAQQLVAEGEEVAALILLDSRPPPKDCPHPSPRDRALIQWQRLRRKGPAYVAEWAIDRARWELGKRQRRRQPQQRELTPAEFRSEQIELAFREALAHYALRPYPGKLVLFRPPLDTAHDLGGGRVANSERELVEHANFWRAWAPGGVDVHVVPGDHDAMVLEPSVRVLAARVRAVLEEAQLGKSEHGGR